MLPSSSKAESMNRYFFPLVCGSMEQTARGLRLLLEEQMKDDESKKK